MNITKIKIKNLFGIKEYEADGRSLELSGKNGTGKSSVLDAIKYALTNKSDREYIVHKGETEGEQGRLQVCETKWLRGWQPGSISAGVIHAAAAESNRVHEDG